MKTDFTSKMSIRWFLLLSCLFALGLTKCVDKVTDCHRAYGHCGDLTRLGQTVRTNCAQTCDSCTKTTTQLRSHHSHARHGRHPKRTHGKCSENEKCPQWKDEGFCTSKIHTSATKHWLCPSSCFNCKGKRAKPGNQPNPHRRSKPHKKPPTHTHDSSPLNSHSSGSTQTHPLQPPQTPQPSRPPQPSTSSKPKPAQPPAPRPSQKPTIPTPTSPSTSTTHVPLIQTTSTVRPMTSASLRFKESLDETVDACDNFYQFTCGNYIKQHPVKSPDDNINLFHETQEMVRKRQVDLILDNTTTTSSAVQKMRIYRDVCMSTNPVNQLKTTKLWEDIKALGMGPIFDDKFNATAYHITEHMLTLSRLSSRHYLFDLSVKKISSIEARLLFLPSPLLYKNPHKYNDMKFANEVKAIKTYITEVLTILVKDVGLNRPKLEQHIDGVIKFDRDRAQVYLANGYTDRETMAAKAENKTFSAVKAAFFIDWDAYIKGDDMLDPAVKQHLQNDPEVYVYTEQFFNNVNRDLGKVYVKDAANYYIVRFILDQVPYLDDRFDAPYHKFIQAVGEADNSASNKRSDDCVDESIAQFPFVNDFLYNTRYLKEDEVQTLHLIDTRKAILSLIDDAKWLDDPSKAKAKVKLNAMKEIVGGIQQVRNETLLDAEYAGVTIDLKDSYREMVVKVTAEKKRRRMKLITMPGEATAFVDFRSTALHAHQIYFENQIYIPAALIQPPFYTKTADYPAVLNFGAYAWLHARQLLHAIDQTGVKFDENGQRIHLLTPQKKPEFESRVAALKNVYKMQVEPQTKRPLNSQQTLSSDIVDHAALNAITRAYSDYRSANPNLDTTVPGFEKYTPEQQLFLAFGTMMCASQGDEYLNRHVVDKQRSPHRVVVNTVVSHNDQFATAFKCPSTSKMNPNNKAQVW